MLGPLQSLQQEKVRERTDEFRTKVAEFGEEFHKTGAPLSWMEGNYVEAYKLLVKYVPVGGPASSVHHTGPAEPERTGLPVCQVPYCA